MNEITETIDYNKRFLIDSKIYNNDASPRAWLLSKTKRISPNGICVATFTQDKFNQYHDYIEKDEEGNIIGMWADYFQSSVAPQSDIPDSSLIITTTSKITTSGNSTQLKIGGSKTFTVSYYEDDQQVEHDPGEWSFTIDNEDASDLLYITYPANNKVKIKFKGDDNYIGKILSITNTSGEVVSSMEVEIIAL